MNFFILYYEVMGSDCTRRCMQSQIKENDAFQKVLDGMRAAHSECSDEDVSKTVLKKTTTNYALNSADESTCSELQNQKTQMFGKRRQGRLELLTQPSGARDNPTSTNLQKQAHRPQLSNLYPQFEESSFSRSKHESFLHSDLKMQSNLANAHLNAQEYKRRESGYADPSKNEVESFKMESNMKEPSTISKEQDDSAFKNREEFVSSAFFDLLEDKEFIRYSNINYKQSARHDHSIHVENSLFQKSQNEKSTKKTISRRSKTILDLAAQNS